MNNHPVVVLGTSYEPPPPASVYPTLSCVEFRFSVGGFARSISFSVDPDYHRYRFIYFYQLLPYYFRIFNEVVDIVSLQLYEHKTHTPICCLSFGIDRGFSLNPRRQMDPVSLFISFSTFFPFFSSLNHRERSAKRRRARTVRSRNKSFFRTRDRKNYF